MALEARNHIKSVFEKVALVSPETRLRHIGIFRNIDIPLAADHFRYFASVIEAEEGSATVLDNRYLSLVLREPIGVVGQIVPWNFPFTMAAWKLAPVLAAGDTTVFKPSSMTSLSVLAFAEMTKDIIPAGVFQVITGSGRDAGQAILEHPDLRKLAFTGSTEVGYTVAKAAADKLIPATLELGGKSANIFFDDMDFEKAMEVVKAMDEIALAHHVPVGEVAINYTADHPFISTALVGVSKRKHAKMNCDALDWTMSEKEKQLLEEAAEKARV